MFEIRKKIFYFTPDIIYEFQLSLMVTNETVATVGASSNLQSCTASECKRRRHATLLLGNWQSASVSIMPASWEVACRWAAHVAHLPLLVLHESPPLPLLDAVGNQWKLHACKANNLLFSIIFFYYLLYVFGIVLNCFMRNNSYCLPRQYFFI